MSLSDSPNLWGLLRTPFRALVSHIECELETAGYGDIRRAHFRVFRAASEVDGFSLTELAKQSQITKQSVAYLIDDLEQHGYAERVPNPDDGRVRIVRLTAKGRAVEREIRKIVARIEDEWSGRVGAEQFATFRQTLAFLAADLTRSGQTPTQTSPSARKRERAGQLSDVA